MIGWDVEVPIPKKIRKIKKKPIIKWLTEPAPRTINRREVDDLMKARGASSSLNSSWVDIPTILQYPPAGIAFTPNSVSPRVIDQIL